MTPRLFVEYKIAHVIMIMQTNFVQELMGQNPRKTEKICNLVFAHSTDVHFYRALQYKCLAQSSISFPIKECVSKGFALGSQLFTKLKKEILKPNSYTIVIPTFSRYLN